MLGILLRPEMGKQNIQLNWRSLLTTQRSVFFDEYYIFSIEKHHGSKIYANCDHFKQFSLQFAMQWLWCQFREFGIGSSNNSLIDIFLYSHHLLPDVVFIW